MKKLQNLKSIEFQAAPFFGKLGSQNKLSAELIKFNKLEFAVDSGWLRVSLGATEFLIPSANIKSIAYEASNEKES